MKIEKEIFPAGTDSRFFREVGMRLFYNLPMIYLGGYCLEVLPRIFLVRFLNIRIVLSTYNRVVRERNPSRSGKSPNFILSGKTDIIFEEKPGKNEM